MTAQVSEEERKQTYTNFIRGMGIGFVSAAIVLIILAFIFA